MAKAPEYVKQAFVRWVEGWGWDVDRAKSFYPYNELVFDAGENDEEWPLTRLLGKLWRCTEELPADSCERLDLPPGSTYARAAQALLARGRTRGKYMIPRSGYRVPPE